MKREDQIRLLGSIESKLETLIASVKENKLEFSTRLDKLDVETNSRVSKISSRVRTLEKKQYAIIAFAGVISTLIITYVQKIWKGF